MNEPLVHNAIIVLYNKLLFFLFTLLYYPPTYNVPQNIVYKKIKSD